MAIPAHALLVIDTYQVDILDIARGDIKVEFRGLRTARVYPEELPNLPLGSQQILLGRYLPQGADQTGEQPGRILQARPAEQTGVLK